MKKILSIISISGISLVFASGAHALPALQLDIDGGTYDPVSQTTISNGDIFTLYAYLVADKDNTILDTYFISAALTPKTSTLGTYGSFDFDGATIDVTADMTYGTPPLESLFPDIGDHGIFDTYYIQFAFTFDSDDIGQIANVAEPSEGTKLGYFAAFNIDTTSLFEGYEIHFDLYNENIITKPNKTDYSTQFAPFSHDAESGGTSPVPEPATMLLFGTGLAGLAGFARKKYSSLTS